MRSPKQVDGIVGAANLLLSENEVWEIESASAQELVGSMDNH